MRNIELKARLADYAAAQQVAAAIATKRLGTQHQIDTYFHCHHGRLKLRQIDGLRAELVWYARADEAVLGPQTDETAGRALLDSLMCHFAIAPADLLANSYGEMVR